MPDNRHTHRISFDCKVEFKARKILYSCELIDISINGALIGNCSDETPPEGTPCKLTLTLDESSKVQIVMLGTIAHKTENRLGIHCQTIDIVSMTHLRKLVEYNIGDPELLERDFEALFK